VVPQQVAVSVHTPFTQELLALQLLQPLMLKVRPLAQRMVQLRTPFTLRQLIERPPVMALDWLRDSCVPIDLRCLFMVVCVFL
jgi:hypothetical protein